MQQMQWDQFDRSLPMPQSPVVVSVGLKLAQRMSPRILRGAVVIFGVIVAVHLMVKK